jgi:hypothetical protein
MHLKVQFPTRFWLFSPWLWPRGLSRAGLAALGSGAGRKWAKPCIRYRIFFREGAYHGESLAPLARPLAFKVPHRADDVAVFYVRAQDVVPYKRR